MCGTPTPGAGTGISPASFAPTAPRVTPITGKADVAAEYHEVVDKVLAVFGNIRGPFSMALHSPKLAEHMVGLVRFFREDTVVPFRPRLLAILATVREREADYVWAAQVRYAREHGMDEATIDALRTKADVASVPDEDRDIVNYARGLTRDNAVDQATFDRLKERYGVPFLVELTAAMNFYGMLCGIANAFTVPPLPGGDRFR